MVVSTCLDSWFHPFAVISYFHHIFSSTSLLLCASGVCSSSSASLGSQRAFSGPPFPSHWVLNTQTLWSAVLSAPKLSALALSDLFIWASPLFFSGSARWCNTVIIHLSLLCVCSECWVGEGEVCRFCLPYCWDRRLYPP